MLKLEVKKKHSCREIGESSHFPLVPPYNSKTPLSSNNFIVLLHVKNRKEV